MTKQKRISVRKIKEILRLDSLNLSQRKISSSVQVSRSTVQEYLSKAASANVSWESVKDLNDDSITELLQGKKQPRKSSRPEPDYAYAEATLSQNSSDWIGSNIRALEFFGGAPKILVPDNLKAGVTSPCYYEPGINNAYQDFATHYNIAVLPARVRKPKDKGKVESAVQCVERRILAVLRNRKFFSLWEINKAIKEELLKLNNRKMQGYDCSRLELFESMEKPALQELPSDRFIHKDVKKAKVNIDYHIEYQKIFYSVPYELIKEYIEVHATDRTVEIYHKGTRVASHLKGTLRHQAVTDPAHMPPRHSAISNVNAEWLSKEALKIGIETEKQVKAIISSRRHQEQGYRACLGLIRLAKKYNPEQLEAACKLANESELTSYKRISNILSNSPSIQDLTKPETRVLIKHKNLRGSEYYH